VLLSFEFPSLNGGERSILAVLPQLVGTEFEFVAVAPAQGPLAEALQSVGVPTLPFDVRDVFGMRRPVERLLEDFAVAIRRTRPDLVHGNSLSMARLTGSIANQSPAVCTAHLRDIIGLSAAAVQQVNSNRALIAVSKAVRDFHAAQGVDASRMQVIPNGIEVDDGQGPHDGRLEAELGLPPGSFLVASVGQICLRKGQDVFAQAAVLAAAQMPAAHFLLIGERYSAKPESAAYDESIDRTFAAAGLADRFHRLGFRQDVTQLLAEVDLLVHSARQEPLGRVLLEAAAAGCPIVATNVGGTSEMLIDDQSALLVPADDPQALAAAMIRAFGDASLRDRLADWARARIATYFSIADSARRLADTWRGLLNQ
jgi:glycosyltransferase involved in cell wall biosynthesis